jgi:hypothetical protein
VGPGSPQIAWQAVTQSHGNKHGRSHSLQSHGTCFHWEVRARRSEGNVRSQKWGGSVLGLEVGVSIFYLSVNVSSMNDAVSSMLWRM